MILKNFEAFEKDLDGQLRPVYLLTGPEQFQCRQALKLLKAKVLAPGTEDFNFSEFTPGQSSIEEIKESLATYPMLSGYRLVLVQQAEKLKEYEQESLLKELKTLPRRNIAALVAPELDHRKKFYKTFCEKHCVADFQTLKGIALERWAAGFLKKRGYAATSVSIKKIVEIAGADMQTLAMELEKLMLHAGNSRNISDEAIEDLVRAGRQHGIFELINAVGRRDHESALRSLANLLGMGEHPLVIVTMLARQCRQVLITKECLCFGTSHKDIAAAAQIPFFILDQFIQQARAADADAVREMYIRLALADRKLKSTQLNGRAMLERLICGIA
jgi:DNA polymerase III subunit delta